MIKQCSIAIVGAGASGIALLNQIVNSVPKRLSQGGLRVTIFEGKAGKIGGNAYEQDATSNLMNTTCGAIDRNFGHGFGILQWLNAYPARWRDLAPDAVVSESLYLPRPVVGRYLEDLYQHAKDVGRSNGLQIDIIPNEVTHILPGSNHYSLETSGGSVWRSRYVYLALGHLESRPSQGYELMPAYHPSPYPVAELVQRIPKTASVGVIGTRLSAIDTCIALTESGHQGPIYCVSRSGRLPAVRAEKGRYQFDTLARDKLLQQNSLDLSLNKIVSLIHREILVSEGRDLQLSEVLAKDLNPERYYEQEISLSKGKARPWQAVLYATNSNIDLLWHQLAESDKAFVAKNWLSEWFLYRASIPVTNAEIMLRLLREKRISVHGGAGKIRFLEETGQFGIEIADHHALQVDHVVDARGSAGDITSTTHTLINNLLQSRMIRPSPYGGIECGFETGQVVSERDRHLQGLFALGPITSGTYFFTTALEIIERQARERAQDLSFRLAEDLLARKHQDTLSNVFPLTPHRSTSTVNVPQETLH